MSIHATISPDAKAALATQRRNSTITSIIIALLLCTLLGVILYIIALSPIFKNTDPTVAYSTSSDHETPLTKPEMRNQVETKPAAPASQMARVITANTPKATAVPVPIIEVQEPSIDFGDSDDFGEGWGSGSGNGSGSGGGSFSAFGRTGNTGMTGHFYDLKQSTKKRATSLGKFYEKNTDGSRVEEFKDELKRIHRSSFSSSRLSKYYKANKKLVFTHLVMAQTSADAAPVAFGVEKEVQPSGWIVVYEGSLESDFDKDFRFVGRYDDLLLVYVNGKVVFDGSWSDHSGEFDKGSDYSGPSLINVPMKASPYLNLNRGDKLRIVIGESPGGLVGGGLFIQEKDKEYRKSTAGHDILPPFATEILHPDEILRLKGLSIPVETTEVPIFKMK